MNPESHIDPQVEELLQSITTHSKNARRQADILQKVDQLSTTEASPKRRMGWLYRAGLAAAACAAAVLLVRPAAESPLVAECPVMDSPITVASIQESPQGAPLQLTSVRKAVPVQEPLEQQPLYEEEPQAEISSMAVAEPQEQLSVPEESETAEAAAAAAPQRIVIESQKLVTYKKRLSRSRRDGDGMKKDLFGNPIRPDDGILFAMQL